MIIQPFLHRYPVFVHGRHPKNKTVRGAVVIKDIEIAVPVLNGSEAPVAATIRTPLDLMGRQTIVSSDFRHFEGAFYTMSQMQPSALEDAFANPFAAHGDSSRLVWEVSSNTRDFQCWPKDIMDQFNNPNFRLPAGDLCIRESGSIILEPGQEQILATQRVRAEAMAGYFVVVDGKVWERSPEPAYKLKASDKKMYVDARETHGYRFAKAGIHAGDALFSLHDRKGAAGILATYYGGGQQGWPEVDIRMPEVFTTDYATLNFAEFASCLGDAFSYSYRGAISERAAALKLMVKDVAVDAIDFGDVEGAVVELLEHHRRDSIFREIDGKAIEMHMELWDSRPVEIQRFQPNAPTR